MLDHLVVISKLQLARLEDIFNDISRNLAIDLAGKIDKSYSVCRLNRPIKLFVANIFKSPFE